MPGTLRKTPCFQLHAAQPAICTYGHMKSSHAHRDESRIFSTGTLSLLAFFSTFFAPYKKIIAWADVVTESYAPGAMNRWGLNYDNLVKIKPDIIMISTCGLGQTGPFATQPIVGTQLGSMPGFTNLTGWPDRGPTQLYGAYTDVVAPIIGVCTLLAALDYRRRTGKGQHIDQSQFEAGINFLSPVFIEYMVNGREADRVGNRSHYATPHNAYPCQGNDRWCVITVFTDEEWQSFCQAIGNPQWTEDARFATLLSRKENEDELDNLVADWTLNFTAEEVMDRMQLFGIPAGVVNTAEDIHHDTQLKHRQHLVSLPHAELGEEIYENYPFKLSRTPAQLRTGAPCLGQHNEYVYTEILGMPDEEFAELLSQDILE